MSVNPIPDGFHTVTPYLIVDDVSGLLAFLERAFDIEELERVTLPDGSIMHAQVKIGDSPVMMGGSKEDWPAMPAFLHLYVPDADRVYEQAIAAGATSLQDPRDEFYGDRTAGVKDAFGNMWWIATRQEEVPPEEIERRAAEIRGQ